MKRLVGARCLAVVGAVLATGLTSACDNGAGALDGTPAPSTADAAQPTTDAADDAAVVRRDTFQISYRLEGSSVDSEQVPVVLPPGTRLDDATEPGSAVARGDVIGRLSADPEYRAALAASAATNRVDAARLVQLDSLAGDVLAPASGTLVIGERGEYTIASPGVDAVVPLTGVQMLRLSTNELTGQAVLETAPGRRTVPCEALWVVRPQAADVEGQAGELHCRVSRLVETAGGLRATITVQSVPIDDAIVVPEVMVGYDDTGYVVTIVQDGQEEVVQVDVGPGDGVLRVVETQIPVGAELKLPSQR